MSHVTEILAKIESGDEQAAEELLPLVYQELRKLAAAKMAQEKPGQTLQPTALVHDAYLRLVDGDRQWQGRSHFFAAAAEAMRRILVEQARRKRGPRRGGHLNRVSLDVAYDLSAEKAKHILDVHDALADVESESPMAAQLVKLRFFAGMTQQEAADCLQISRSTADRYWAYAKAAVSSALKDTTNEKKNQGG